MSQSQDRLYDLLPYVYRLRDADQGYPLHALLRVIAEQVNLVEEDIARLYDNWFIETAEDWVVPYIGDLVGYEAVYDVGEPGDVNDRAAQQRQRIVSPRADVANTIRYRRLRGTLAVLELLARDVAGWPARAVEFYRLLGLNQAVNHVRLERGQMVDLRQGDRLIQIGGPFDEFAHTVDVRRIHSTLTRGHHNPFNVGLFVWRQKVRQVNRTVAGMLDEQPNCFTFSILRNDVPLYLRPQPETDPTTIAQEKNLPVPILRREMDRWQKEPSQGPFFDTIYGEGDDKSLAIWAVYEDRTPRPRSRQKQAESARTSSEPVLIAAEQVRVADLSGWRNSPKNPKENTLPTVMVDPELGRIAFPEHPVKGKRLVEVQVMYHYAESDDLGGGTYERPISDPVGLTEAYIYTVRKAGGNGASTSLKEAIVRWKKDAPPTAVIEIADSGVYEESLKIDLAEGQTLQVRAANQERPVIILPEVSHSQFDAWVIEGEHHSHLVLDGLLIANRSVRVHGPAWAEDDQDAPDERAMCEIILRHCTLVPGWMPAREMGEDSLPRKPEEYSLELIDTGARVVIEHSIVGAIRVIQDEVLTDPIPIRISDSILDATDRGMDALEGMDGHPAHTVLRIERSTVIGRVSVHAIELAENSIFDGTVRVTRRQWGCMRFCWYDPIGSRVPGRFHCQPDLAAETLRTEESIPLEQAMARERQRLQPCLVSQRYGSPVYCQLALECAEEVKTGADDRSEMGVYHDLYQPQREANLQMRLDAFVPAGVDAGVLFAG